MSPTSYKFQPFQILTFFHDSNAKPIAVQIEIVGKTEHHNSTISIANFPGNCSSHTYFEIILVCWIIGKYIIKIKLLTGSDNEFQIIFSTKFLKPNKQKKCYDLWKICGKFIKTNIDEFIFTSCEQLSKINILKENYWYLVQYF